MERMAMLGRILQDIRPGTDFETSEDFIREGLLDSFDLIRLVHEIEKEFRICIQGKDIVPENFVSLCTIDSLLGRHLAVGG